MKSFTEFTSGNDNKMSLPKLKNEISNACGIKYTTHKWTKMGNHAGMKVSYGNGVGSDSFKIARINSNEFNIEVHNSNQDILGKIEKYLATTGYSYSRSAFNINIDILK